MQLPFNSLAWADDVVTVLTSPRMQSPVPDRGGENMLKGIEWDGEAGLIVAGFFLKEGFLGEVSIRQPRPASLHPLSTIGKHELHH